MLDSEVVKSHYWNLEGRLGQKKKKLQIIMRKAKIKWLLHFFPFKIMNASIFHNPVLKLGKRGILYCFLLSLFQLKFG
jgi:hypothetical protein